MKRKRHQPTAPDFQGAPMMEVLVGLSERVERGPSIVLGGSYLRRDGRLGFRHGLARRRRCDHRSAGHCVRCFGHHGDSVHVGIALRRRGQPTRSENYIGLLSRIGAWVKALK